MSESERLPLYSRIFHQHHANPALPGDHPSYAQVVKTGDATATDGSSTASEESPTRGGNLPSVTPYKTAIPQQPVTVLRKPFAPGAGSPIVDAGIPRATIAASEDAPNGTTEGDWAKNHQHQTVIMQHAKYWDPDDDGIISPWDTYNGCRAWGWSIPLCLLVAFIINFSLSYPTVPGWLPDPFFRIWLDRLYKDKHGSDSMTFDNEGRFKPQNFEDIFAKYDKGNKGGLTWSDLYDLWKGQRVLFDLFGLSAAILEWTATYLLLWPEDGVMRKDDIRAVYDGSIFYRKKAEWEAKQAKKHQPAQTSPRLVTKAQKLL